MNNLIQSNTFIYKLSIYVVLVVAVVFALVLFINLKPIQEIKIKYNRAYIVNNSTKINNNLAVYTNTSNNVVVVDVDIPFTEQQESLTAQVYANMLQLSVGNMLPSQLTSYLNQNTLRYSVTYYNNNININIQGLGSNKVAIFNLLNMALNNPTINTTLLNIVKQNLLVDLKTSNNTDWDLLNAKALTTMYGNTYIVRNAKNIQQVSLTNLQNYKNKYIDYNNVFIGISGNITSQEATGLISNTLVNLPKKPLQEKNNNAKVVYYPNITSQTIAIPKNNLAQSSALIVFEAPDVDKEHELWLISVLNYYLGEMPEAVLLNEVRNKQGLVYHISSHIKETKQTTFWYVVLAASPQNIDKAINLTIQTMQTVFAGNFTNKNIQTTLKWMELRHIQDLNNNSNIASFLSGLLQSQHSFTDYSAEFTTNKQEIMDALKTINTNKFLILKTVPAQ